MMPCTARSPCDAGTVAGARLAGRPQQPPRVCAASCGALQHKHKRLNPGCYEKATLRWTHRCPHRMTACPYAGNVMATERFINSKSINPACCFLHRSVVSESSRNTAQSLPHPVFLTTVSSFVPQEQEQQGNGRQHQVPPPCRLESKPQQQQLMSSGIFVIAPATTGVARLSALGACVGEQTQCNGSQHNSNNIQLADSLNSAAQRDCTCALKVVWMACWWTCSRRQVRQQSRRLSPWNVSSNG